LLAKAKADTYLTETGKPIKDDTFHAPLPRGPAGHFSFHGPFSNIIPSYSNNQEAAKDFLRWFRSKEVYDEWSSRSRVFRWALRRSGKTIRCGR
jgi:ABC-type glycerol-3-phosphate transport system substrate-binding protein